MRNQRGVLDTLAVVLIAVVSVIVTPLILKNSNPFDRSADPANRRTASAISGRDIVDITKEVAKSPEPVTVHIDRSVEAKAEVTDPKLTLSQKIGRFISGLSIWALLAIIAGFAVFGVGFPAMLFQKYLLMKETMKRTVQAVRELDDDTYKKVAPKLSDNMDRSHKKVVDKLKAELN